MNAMKKRALIYLIVGIVVAYALALASLGVIFLTSVRTGRVELVFTGKPISRELPKFSQIKISQNIENIFGESNTPWIRIVGDPEIRRPEVTLPTDMADRFVTLSTTQGRLSHEKTLEINLNIDNGVRPSNYCTCSVDATSPVTIRIPKRTLDDIKIDAAIANNILIENFNDVDLSISTIASTDVIFDQCTIDVLEFRFPDDNCSPILCSTFSNCDIATMRIAANGNDSSFKIRNEGHSSPLSFQNIEISRRPNAKGNGSFELETDAIVVEHLTVEEGIPNHIEGNFAGLLDIETSTSEK